MGAQDGAAAAASAELGQLLERCDQPLAAHLLFREQIEGVVIGRRFLRLRELGIDELLTQITDRKSTRLNSSHLVISYAVFCLKKKKRLRAIRPRPSCYPYSASNPAA